jgi:hypothetical protein
MARITFPPDTLRPVTLGPDLSGLRQAQDALRAVLGVDAVFLIAGVLAWPPGTPLDPETSKPYDPFLDPIAPAVDTEVEIRCSFVHHPLQSADPQASPIGAGDLGEAALIIAEADYPLVADATRVRVGVELWDIQQFRYDIALTVPRWLAYLERA